MTTLAPLRLAVRANKLESFGVVVFVLGALGVAAFVVARLATAGIPTACFTGQGAAALCAGLEPQMTRYLDFAGQMGFYALAGITLLPVVAGLFAGVALAGKEIDRGTAVFAWALGPSRRQWLLSRVVPVALILVAAGLAAGWLADALEGLRDPGVDPGRSFEHLGLRGGAVIAMETLAILGLSLAAGALLGRVLPAVLIAGLLAAGSIFVVQWVTGEQLRRETVAVLGIDGGPTGPERWRVVDYRVLAPTGEILTWEEAYNRYGDPGALEGEDAGVDQLRTALFVNPGEMYPLAAARMAIEFGAIGFASIVLATAIVDRRRPAP